jgi:hypothetical protein
MFYTQLKNRLKVADLDAFLGTKNIMYQNKTAQYNSYRVAEELKGFNSEENQYSKREAGYITCLVIETRYSKLKAAELYVKEFWKELGFENYGQALSFTKNDMQEVLQWD